MIRKLLLIWTIVAATIFRLGAEESASFWTAIPGDTDVYEAMR